jgi:UDP-N-acetylglucosamine 2-epimerase (non-hydrolysing)
MSAIFKRLDAEFNHVLVHSGQHYDNMLSDVFFECLHIRKPDYNLGVGAPGRQHYHITSELSVKLMELFNDRDIKPDIVLFLGDSNSVLVAPVVRKEGHAVGHIEAGMRSHDKRMLEEINRIVCDHTSNLLFVYHSDYKDNCLREGVDSDSIHVVGNTIVEVCLPFVDKLSQAPKRRDCILLDIHRPENFMYKDRLLNIVRFANDCINKLELPVYMLKFGRTMQYVQDFGIDLEHISPVGLMSYVDFLEAQYRAAFLISDSGTAQEEPALLKTPVIVPRDYTERPQSVDNDCSFMLDVNSENSGWKASVEWATSNPLMRSEWLGDGRTAEHIAAILREERL